MSSRTRLGKRNAPVQLDMASLSNTERLLLAQAVYELGAESWLEVSQLLTKHPLIRRPKNSFAPDSCEELYVQLMQEAGLERPENGTTIHAPVHLKLAQKHYQARVHELRDLIAAEEVKFKTLVKEIDDIRAGLWEEEDGRTDDASQEVVRVVEPAEEILEDQVPTSNAAAEVSMATPSASPMEEKEASQASVEAAIDAEAPNEEIPSTQTPASPSGSTPPSPAVVEEEGGEDEDQGPTEEHHAMDEDIENNEPSAPSPDAPVTSAMNAVSESLGAPGGNEEQQPPQQEEEEEGQDSATKLDADDDVEMTESTEAVKAEKEASAIPEDVELQQVTQAVEVDADEEVSDGGGDEEQEQEQAATPSESSNLSKPREGKRRASEVDLQRDRKRAREDSEPADEDEQSVSGRRRNARTAPNVDPAALKRFQTVISMLHSQIAQHRNGAIFQNPIKTSEAPDYHDIVKRPMDLKTIKQKIKDGLIVNSVEFQRDIYLIFANAMMYNRPGSDIYRMAEQMMLDSEAHINTFRQTEGFVRGVHRI